MASGASLQARSEILRSACSSVVPCAVFARRRVSQLAPLHIQQVWHWVFRLWGVLGAGPLGQSIATGLATLLTGTGFRSASFPRLPSSVAPSFLPLHLSRLATLCRLRYSSSRRRRRVLLAGSSSVLCGISPSLPWSLSSSFPLSLLALGAVTLLGELRSVGRTGQWQGGAAAFAPHTTLALVSPTRSRGQQEIFQMF